MQSDPQTPPDTDTCEQALAAILGRCTTALDAELAVFLGSDDMSGPHKSRVALRRITTALDAFAPILRKRPRKALRAEAKAIFRSLGKVRDSDVYLATHADEPGHDTRQEQNRKLREKTRDRLRKTRAVTFAPRLSAALGPEGDLMKTKPRALLTRAQPVRDFATTALDQAWQAALACGPSVVAMPVAAQHEFRKDMKTVRYLAEFFAEHFPALAQDPFRQDFRDLQDALGTLNDYDVALTLAGKRRPKALPPTEARALATAEAIWSRLGNARLPWRDDHDQPTR